MTTLLPMRRGAPPTVVGPAPHGQRSQTEPETGELDSSTRGLGDRRSGGAGQGRLLVVLAGHDDTFTDRSPENGAFRCHRDVIAPQGNHDHCR